MNGKLAKNQEPKKSIRTGGAALDIKEIESLGLSVARIETHQQRILRALDGTLVTTLEILGACTTNNGAVLPWKKLVRFAETDFSGHGRAFLDSAQKYWTSRYLVSCIPAAGAASRYLAALRKFVNAFEGHLTAAHLAAAQQIYDSKLNLGSDMVPALPPQERRALRARLRSLELSSDLLSLAEESFGNAKDRIQKLSAEIANHLTSNTPFTKRATFEPSKEDKHLNLEPSVHSAQPLPNEESYMRQHWNSFNNDGHPPKLMLATQAKHWSEIVATTEGSALQDSEISLANVDTLESDGPLHKQEKTLVQAYAAARVVLDEFEGLSKALVQTTEENDSFLFLKIVEQMSLAPCLANVVVCPAGLMQEFSSEILKLGNRLRNEVKNIFETARTPFAPDWVARLERKRGEWVVLEQGNELSTIRFCMDGTPHLSSKGSYTRVSAGHGELVNLFDNILDQFPEAECVHVRNIDNIIGTGPERRKEIGTPARLFRVVRDCLEALRSAIQKHNKMLHENSLQQSGWQVIKDPSAKGALAVLQSLAYVSLEPNQGLPAQGLFDLSGAANTSDPNEVALDDIFNVLSNLFHWPSVNLSLPANEKARLLESMLQKPLSVFGVVRKETGDIGGGPVFARLPGGETVKLCMEMPHATDEDRESYFGARGKATHFNPVLVFFELQTNSYDGGKRVDFKKLIDDRFWLLAVKEFEGSKVCYHETVLYELIGNSATSNVLFAEVPRTLFKPHKTLFNSLGQDRRSYGFDETLKTQEDRGASGRPDH